MHAWQASGQAQIAGRRSVGIQFDDEGRSDSGGGLVVMKGQATGMLGQAQSGLFEAERRRCGAWGATRRAASGLRRQAGLLRVRGGELLGGGPVRMGVGSFDGVAQ